MVGRIRAGGVVSIMAVTNCRPTKSELRGVIRLPSRQVKTLPNGLLIYRQVIIRGEFDVYLIGPVLEGELSLTSSFTGLECP